jgi:hypothetical protein
MINLAGALEDLQGPKDQFKYMQITSFTISTEYFVCTAPV